MQIYVRANIGSARGGAGYEANVAPGDHTYTWTTNATARSAVAASFIVIPEPSAAVLLSLGGALLLLRRRIRA
jgi:hypothetical protein